MRTLFTEPDKAEKLLKEREDLHKDLRYALNDKAPKTEQDARDKGWIRLPWYKALFHNPFKNNKYVAPDGHMEGVYDRKTGRMDMDPRVMPTFNFFSPNTHANSHMMADVNPYKKWGN